MSDIRTVYRAALEPFAGRFEPAPLLRAAEAATGLADWGGARWAEPRFRERLATFCADLETTAALTPTGRGRAHSRLHVLLCSRLRQVAARRGAASVDITAPLVGTGLARAGTTFLHGLLARDPDNLVATAAQAAIPVPPPGSPAIGEDERVALYGEILDHQGFTAADVTEIHPFAADLPEECLFLQEASCASPLGAYFHAPNLAALYAGQAHVDDAYAWQKGMMATLQGERDGRRWLLKSPVHVGRVDALFRHFPDALVFVNHRDPGRVIASMASLYVKVYRLSSDGGVDPSTLGPQLVETWRRLLDDLDVWRAAHPEARIVDVQYAELIADPIGVAERLYARFGLSLGAAAKEAMAAHLAVDRHGKGPQRSYALADFGLAEDDIERAFGDYIERHGVRREKRQ